MNDEAVWLLITPVIFVPAMRMAGLEIDTQNDIRLT
jgi:hypothetical protein